MFPSFKKSAGVWILHSAPPNRSRRRAAPNGRNRSDKEKDGQAALLVRPMPCLRNVFYLPFGTSVDFVFNIRYATIAPIIIPIKLQIKSSTSKLLPKNSCATSKQIGTIIAAKTILFLLFNSVMSGRKNQMEQTSQYCQSALFCPNFPMRVLRSNIL